MLSLKYHTIYTLTTLFLLLTLSTIQVGSADSDEVMGGAIPEYGFTLRLVNGGVSLSSTCSRCPWLKKCDGQCLLYYFWCVWLLWDFDCRGICIPDNILLLRLLNSLLMYLYVSSYFTYNFSFRLCSAGSRRGGSGAARRRKCRDRLAL